MLNTYKSQASNNSSEILQHSLYCFTDSRQLQQIRVGHSINVGGRQRGSAQTALLQQLYRVVSNLPSCAWIGSTYCNRNCYYPCSGRLDITLVTHTSV
jgi:hypothetical protein